MKKLLSLTLTLFIFFTPNVVLSGASLDSISYSNDNLAKGLYEYQNGNYTAAVDLWYECTQAKPGVNMEDLKNRGTCANNIGHMVFEGLGYDQDYRIAIDWLEQAKDWGFQDDDGRRMIKEAKARLEDARDKSVPNLRPMFERLGYRGKTMGLAIQAYNNGQYKTAFLNFKKCADKSKDDYYVHCPIYLGMLHYTGIGTEQDISLAIFHLQKGLNARPYDDEIVDFGRNTLKSARKKLSEAKQLEKTIDSIESNKRKLEDQLAIIKNPIIDSYRGKAKKLLADIENNSSKNIDTLETFDNQLMAMINGINNKIDNQKKAEEKRVADQKKAEEKRVANEKLNKATSLLPPKTKLHNAQNFIQDIEEFVSVNPNELDIMEVAMFKINTKLLSEGTSDDEQMKTLELFKDSIKSSTTFLEFQKKKKESRNQQEVKKITQLMNTLEGRINYLQKELNKDSSSKVMISKRIDSAQSIFDNPSSFSALKVLDNELFQFIKDLKSEKKIESKIRFESITLDQNIFKLKTYLTENISSITPELMTLIVKNINTLESTKKQNYTNKNNELKALKKANDETSSFISNNNVLTNAALAELKKKTEQKKKAEEQKRKTDAKKKADAKEAKRLRNFKTIRMTCYFDRFISIGEAQQKWVYDGKTVSLNGERLSIGKIVNQGYGKMRLEKLSDQDSFRGKYYGQHVEGITTGTQIQVGGYTYQLAHTWEVNFDNKTSLLIFGRWRDNVDCY